MRLIIIAIWVMAVTLMSSIALAQEGGQEMETQGKVTVIKHEKATIHSYMAPEDSALVTTQVIETENHLVVIDGAPDEEK